MVALRTPSLDQSVAALGQDIRDDIFELSDLVATEAKTCRRVLAFCPDLGFSGSGRVEMTRKIGKRMQRRRMIEQKRSALEGSERLRQNNHVNEQSTACFYWITMVRMINMVTEIVKYVSNI
jgi:hypothetical protein